MAQNWFITGITSGFGRIMAEKLLARGDRVAGTYRREGKLDELKAQYGDQLWLASLDITDTKAVRNVVNSAFAALGRVDVVVNNAGYGLFGAAEEVTDEQIEKQIATNLTGNIQVIRAVLPHLRAQRSGRIIQVSSEGGQIAYPNFGLYHATKWGVEGFVEAMAQEVIAFGISCTIAEPGPSQTDFGAGLAVGEPMPEYADTPSGAMREAIKNGDFKLTGDAVKFAQAMIDSVDVCPAPKRVALGSTAFGTISKALTERLAELNAQRDLCFATDVDAELAV